ncbi:MAG: MCE family protein [Actinomycetota bacterium]|nr:MCE family protein [Actinomycetota bacterium]
MSLLLIPAPVRAIGAAAKLKVLGLIFLIVIVALVGFTIAIYNKVFETNVPLQLKTGSIGNQLILPADVKLRGILVGQVRSLSSDGTVATMSLAMKPSEVKLVPANVRARILPKTLFGEKFVDLVIPANEPATGPIKSGATIGEDRSTEAIETGKVFDDLLPLLRTLQPDKLNATLTAFADALRGRGDALGANFALADDYFTQFNPHLETFKTDISGLADLATTYGTAAPDILRIFGNQAFSQRTNVEKRDTLASFLRGTAGFANTATDVFGANESRLIQLAAVSRPTLQVLATYSPEFPCLLKGLTDNNVDINKTFDPRDGKREARLHITLEVVPQRPAYVKGKDDPKYDEDLGPDCYGLATPHFSRGTEQASADTTNSGNSMAPAFAMGPDGSTGSVGGSFERAVVASVLSPVLDRSADSVPDIAQLLAAPMFRGTAVSVQ